LGCNLANEEDLWGPMAGQKRLLAVITPCKTMGHEAAKEITSYTQMTTTIVTDLQSVVAVVGRVQTRGSWWIIDRTGGIIHPEFIHKDEGADMEE
ncbi:hypothetical protein B0H10DRAFT_1798266, partial [Mycena sp. CBHHK59/15]